MGLSWQQGPLATKGLGRFLTPEPLPERLLFAEPLRRRLRRRLGDEWIADSEDVTPAALVEIERVARHRDLGDTAWFTVRGGDREAERAAWQHTAPPEYASELAGYVAFAWRAMDAFYEEDERIVGHAAAGGALRVRLRPSVVRPASRHRRDGVDAR